MSQNTPRLTATMTRAASATQYAASDIIANSTTAADVVPISFGMPVGKTSGIITGMRCVITPASGNLVITACDFDVLLFRPTGSIPFAAGSYPADNAALAVSAAAMRELVGIFRFSSALWRNPAGTLVAGASGYQSQALYSDRPYAPFNVDGLTTRGLNAIVQAGAAWNPGNVAQQFDFALDVDLD